MNLALAAFLSGLLGSVHCVAMCGGIVGALNFSRSPRREVIRIHADSSASFAPAVGGEIVLQLSYSAGRIGVYALAGAVAGGLGSVALLARSVLPTQVVLGVLANLSIILLGLHLGSGGLLFARLEKLGMPLWTRLAPLSKRFIPADTPTRALAAGMIWGWLPCAMVYGMLPLALLSGGTLEGALTMSAFGLGTLPAMVTAGVFLERMRSFLAQKMVRYVAAACLLWVGFAGLARIPQVQETLRTVLLCFS